MAQESWFIKPELITNWTINPIAGGGFGDVFRATYLGADVAVKQLRCTCTRAELAEFRREINIWHRLHHPHILPLLGACDTESKPFMVSPFMPNGTLKGYVSVADAPRSVGEKLALLIQVTSGMTYLHTYSIVHGDLKSQNVLLDAGPRAVISDFGMSQTKYSSASIRTNMGGMVGGTMDHMAPEMFDDDDPAGSSKRTDVYAFGIMTYETLNNGKPSWVTSDGRPMKDKVIESQICRGKRPRRVPEIADSLWQLLERFWHQDPGSRPAFPEIANHLKVCNEELPNETPSQSLHQPLCNPKLVALPLGSRSSRSSGVGI
ncbi:kinase-like domain-containing protein [Polychytrium aggregatum]|uniref:kinase-like domain-containing protein n=1 Tax=Polychytrium aggregatum TaxID=110093 RepID=UPI0022FF04E2|nr:kinase-like domain-containing protein [Polychytrium aggregatum]KAI9207416.1 kinase-like domain-containing protein [Polychytrium aggregatum]